MAYTPVPTLTTGHLLTAAEFNAYVADNFAAGVPAIFTTKGDLAAATASGAASRLAVGTNGYVLQADSSQATGIKWAALSNATAARYKRTTTQSVNSASDTIVNFATSVFDTGSAVTTGASWHYTVPSTGYYYISASILLESNAGWAIGELLRAGVYKGGVLQGYLGVFYSQVTATILTYVNGSMVLSLSASDSINVRVYQNSGGAINIAADGDANHISIARIY